MKNHVDTPKRNESRKANGQGRTGKSGKTRSQRRIRSGGRHTRRPRSRPSLNAGQQNLSTITEEAWKALQEANNPPVLYRRLGSIVRVEKGDDGKPILQTVTQDRMRHRLSEVAEWDKLTQKGRQPAKPPVDVVKNVLATPDPHLPVLREIVEIPVFGPGGDLQTQPGYHHASRTLYTPPPGFRLPPLPDRPTIEDLRRAKSIILDDLLGDFPFVGDPDRAHAVALLLLPLVRNLIDGPTPLHLLKKPMPGTGATLMVEAITLASTGRVVSMMTLPDSEREVEYTIAAVLKSGPSVVLLDNVGRKLDSATLASAITTTQYQSRQVKSSDMLCLPIRCVWVATGNNPTMSGEMARRIVSIRLDAKMERPEGRKGFKHPDLLDWVREHRAELAGAGLTLARSWIEGGRPKSGQVLGKFENWSGVVGGILRIAEIPGFLENREELYATADPEDLAWRQFFAEWWGKHGNTKVKVADVFPLAQTCPLDLGTGDERSQTISLGKTLSTKRDQLFEIESDGAKLSVCLRDSGFRQNTKVWRLEKVQGTS